MAVIVVMAIIAILLIYAATNLRTLHHLGRHLNLLEEKQVRRLQTVQGSSKANLPAITNSPATPSATNAPPPPLK